MVTFKNAEQEAPRRMIWVRTIEGPCYGFNEHQVLAYITDNELNRIDTYGGNTGSGEPWNDLPSVPDIQEPRDYLDENFDKVIEQFWKWRFNIIA